MDRVQIPAHILPFHASLLPEQSRHANPQKYIHRTTKDATQKAMRRSHEKKKEKKNQAKSCKDKLKERPP